MFPVIPLRVNGFLQRYQTYLWYQDDTPLAKNRLVGTFQFGTSGKKKLKYPTMIDKKQWEKY